jgi:hypothetical protein
MHLLRIFFILGLVVFSISSSDATEPGPIFLLRVEHRGERTVFSPITGKEFTTIQQLQAYATKILNDAGNAVPLAVVVDRHIDFDMLLRIQDAIYSTGLTNVYFAVHDLDPKSQDVLKLITLKPWGLNRL